MEAMYLEDLRGATEIVLEKSRRRRIRSDAPAPRDSMRERKGSAGRAAAGAVRIGNLLGAALTSRRVIEPVECRMLFWAGLVLLVHAVLFVLFPRVLAYPAGVLLGWIALTLLLRSWRLRPRRRPRASGPR